MLRTEVFCNGSSQFARKFPDALGVMVDSRMYASHSFRPEAGGEFVTPRGRANLRAHGYVFRVPQSRNGTWGSSLPDEQ